MFWTQLRIFEIRAQLTPLFSCCHANVNGYREACTWQRSLRYCHLTTIISFVSSEEIVEKKVFLKILSKFKIKKAPNVLYRRGPRHFEIKQSAISLPLLGTYDQHIYHLRAENEQLRAEKMENVKIINARRRNWQREELKFSSFARNFSF